MKTFIEWINKMISESKLQITSSDIPENLIRGQEYSERPFYIGINPSKSEFINWAAQGARGFADQDGNVYIWQYDNGLHNFVNIAINFYHPDKHVELYIPFYVRINPISHDGIKKPQVYFDGWSKGKIPRRQYKQVLQNSSYFQNLNLGYDLINDELDRRTAPVVPQNKSPIVNQVQTNPRRIDTGIQDYYRRTGD